MEKQSCSLTEFLSALCAGSDKSDAIILIAGDDETPVTNTADVDAFCAQAGDEPIYVSPVTAHGAVPFLYSVIDNAVADQWQDFVLPPTAALHKDGVLICLWSLEAAPKAEAVRQLALDMGGDLDDPIPVPGANGWELVHLDPDAFQPLAVLAGVYTNSCSVPDTTPPSETPPWAAQDFGTLLDARLLSPLDLHDPAYQQELVISVGKNANSMKWRGDRMPVAKLISILARHPEGRQKDGPGFVLAEIAGGNRRKQAVARCYGVGLDIDVGLSGAAIDAALVAFGHLGVRYTTFSNGKTISKLNKDKLVKWCDKHGIEFDGAGVLRFLDEESRWDKTLLGSAEYTGDSHEPEGLMACVSHAPMPKHRIVLPLAEPFDPTKVANTHAEGMRMWAAVCRSVARALGDLPMDNSAVDPSRLFYFPRHPKGRPHETTIMGGPLLDWRTLDLGAAPSEGFEAEVTRTSSGKSRSTTKEGQALGKWSIGHAHGFQIADAIRDFAEDRIRTPGSTKIDIECPFDEDHSNPGDPEDRGCFAVNAGDGPSEIFTIKCQHDACASRTNLDHLGKMLKDGWFDQTVLEDGVYNPQVGADGAAGQPDEVPRIEPRKIDAMIEAMEPRDSNARNKIIAAIARLASEADREMLLAALKGKTGVRISTLRSEVESRRPREAQIADGEVTVLDDGHSVLFYQGDKPDQREASDFILQAMLRENTSEPVWTKNLGGLMHMEHRQGRVAFELLRQDAFAAKIAKLCSFAQVTSEGEKVKTEVPDREFCATVFHDCADSDALPLQPQVRRAPTFDANGDLLDKDGHHGAIFVDLGALTLPPIPDAPTNADVARARALIEDDLLGDFPFRDKGDKGEATRTFSLANAIAMFLTSYMRDLFDGPVPAFGIVKPTSGTGGTLLAKLSPLLLDGVEAATVDYSANDAEMQKTIVSIAQSGESHIFFDNLVQFASSIICRALTSKVIGGRILGLTKWMVQPNTFIWQFTGINPRVTDEMARRVCWIRLNSEVADNHDRVYRHTDLEGWVIAHRGEVIAALLTLIRAWVVAGRPPFKGKGLASFDNWATAVGGVLEHAGIEGFLMNRRAPTADRDNVELQAFAEAWALKFGDVSVSETQLYDWASSAAETMIQGFNEAERKTGFGLRLESLEDRTFTIAEKRRMIERDGDLWCMGLLDERQGPE